MISRDSFKEVMVDTVTNCLPDEKELFDLFGNLVIDNIYEGKTAKRDIVKYDFFDNTKDVIEFVIVAISLYKAINDVIKSMESPNKEKIILEIKPKLESDLSKSGITITKVLPIVENALKVLAKVL